MGGAKRYPSMPVGVAMGIASLHPSYEDALSRSRDALRPRFAISFALLVIRGRRERSMTEANTVLVERDGPVTIVSINRPHCRNAVDGATARKLYDAFLSFDADERSEE